MLASSRTSLVAFASHINPQPTLASSHTSSHSHRTFTPSGHSVRLHTLTARQRQGQGPSLPLPPSSTRTTYPPLRTAPHTAPTRLCLTQLQCKQNDNDNAPDTSTQCDQNPLNTTNIDTDRDTDCDTSIFDTSIKENLNNTLQIPPEVIELYNQFKQFKIRSLAYRSAFLSTYLPRYLPNTATVKILWAQKIFFFNAALVISPTVSIDCSMPKRPKAAL